MTLLEMTKEVIEQIRAGVPKDAAILEVSIDNDAYVASLGAAFERAYPDATAILNALIIAN